MKKILSLMMVLSLILSCAAVPVMASTEETVSVVIDAVTASGTSEYTEVAGTGGAWEKKTNTFWVTNDGVAGVRVHTAAKSGGYVVFNPSSGKLAPGKYRVEWWNMYVTGNSSNNTPSGTCTYDIAYNGGVGTYSGSFEPKTASGTSSGWYSLGEYDFTGNGLETVKVTCNGTAGRFAVDAIRFTLVSSAEDEGEDTGNTGITIDDDGTITIDDTAACFVTGGTTSEGTAVSWDVNASLFADHDGGDSSIMLETKTTAGKTGANVTIIPGTGVITEGAYEVKWWNMTTKTGCGAAKSVAYEICYNGGIDKIIGTFVPDNATGEDAWYTLGKYNFTGNGSEYIKFTKNSSAAGRFSADALKLVPTVIDSEEVFLYIDKFAQGFTSEFAGSGDTTWSFKNNSFFVDYESTNATMLAGANGDAAVVTAKPNATRLTQGVYEVYWYNMVSTSEESVGNPAWLDYSIVCNGGRSQKSGSFIPNAATANGEIPASGWVSLGKCYFTGNGNEYIEVVNNSGEGRFAANAAKFVRVDNNEDNIIVYNLDFIKDGAIADEVTEGSYTAYLEGYNAIPQQKTAKIIIAKYDKSTNTLLDVKFAETNTEIKNTADLSVSGAIEIATPIITVSENENVTLKLFIWDNSGEYTPLLASKSITTPVEVTE